MKKIAIITLYYQNYNYGGLLQAYALNKYFINKGYDSKLISYKRCKGVNSRGFKSRIRNKSFVTLIKIALIKVQNRLTGPIIKKWAQPYLLPLEKRKELLENFMMSIPHTEVLEQSNIVKISGQFDYYVSGSDQIWKPGVVDDIFVFNYLNNDEKIFSYASSVAVSELPEDYINFMRKSLAKYAGISIREKSACEVLEKSLNRSVNWNVDPTLLLEQSEWKNLLSRCLIDEQYIFCYFLGDCKEQHDYVKKVSTKMNCKLVTLPYIKNGSKFEYKLIDRNFGDIQMLEVGIPEFLSLIYNAKAVITDSFHAVCFSTIFEKAFWVLERKTIDSKQKMNERIFSLLEMYGLSSRFVSTKMDIQNLIDMANINYVKAKEKFQPYKNNSIEYLNTMLQD